jgi:predicted MFS family arabinose efflux permease
LARRLALGARFLAGAFSGLVWGMLAGYARRIAAPDRAGRALAVASLGTPIGLSVGTPLGSWLGTHPTGAGPSVPSRY